MKLHVLFLDNSFGDWHQSYQKGALVTWCDPRSGDVKSNSYMGNAPRSILINKFFNWLLLTRVFIGQWGRFNGRQKQASTKTHLSTEIIHVSLPELWSNITAKTLYAIHFVAENFEFDFLIRANSTCYVNLTSLSNELAKIDREVVYAGPVIRSKTFVSGWGIVLSRKAVEILLDSYSSLDFALFDDESIGNIMARNDIFPFNLSFLDIKSADQINQLTFEEISTTPLYRIKVFENDKRIDHSLMNLLHKRIMQLKEDN